MSASQTINNVIYAMYINSTTAYVSGVTNNTLTGYNIEPSVLFGGSIVQVSALGDNCFNGCTKLTSITIPTSVTIMASSCFYNCSSLVSITIPNSVISIGYSCFEICTSLTSITIPSGINILPINCFLGCSKLGSITIPNSVTTIGSSCFYNCSSLLSISIPTSVISIGNNCFYNCTKLASITIPNSVTTIGTSCFHNCISLDSIIMPSSINILGNNCFYNCTSLDSITIPTNIVRIGNNCFYNCAKLASITIPNSVTTIGTNCFQNCILLNAVVINSSKTLNVSSSGFQNKSSNVNSNITFNNAYSYNDLSSSCKTMSTYFYIKLYNSKISYFSIPNKNYGDASFQIEQPTSNSSGSFSYASSNLSVATISDDIITIVGAGHSIITAIQTATDNYNSGTIETTFQVNKAMPTIPNFSISPGTFGSSSFQITHPTSNSSGSFSYTSSNLSVATIIDNIITIVGAGNSIITASQTETENYNSGTIETTFQVNKASPTITSFSIPPGIFGYSSFQITQPTSNSSGSFSYTSSNTSVATITDDIITIVGAGNSIITASQTETENYNSGTIETIFQVNKATPTITSFSISSRTFGGYSFQIAQPTSNSSGLFSYTSSNLSVATISGKAVTIIGAGNTEITADQLATTNYAAGTIETTFQVNKATPKITSFSIPPGTFGDSSFQIIQPKTNSSGSFSYTSSNLSVANITDNIITIVGAGNSIITATQSVTNNYTLGTIKTIFKVNKVTPTIISFSIPPGTFGDSSFQITQPISNSPGSFSYTSSNLSVATITDNTITIVGAGNSLVTATQSVTANYNSGTIETIFQVNKATPTIKSFSIPPRILGDSSFQIEQPTSNSSGSFSYTSSNLSVATISDDIITIVGVGHSIITAIQSTTNNYTSGTIETIFQVKAPPTITSFSIPSVTFGNSSFQITQPTSNSSGSFSYTSSNLSVANITDNIITIVGAGHSIITATQSETTNYIAGKIETIFQANKATPTIKNFSFPSRTFGDSSFQIIQPTSNSSGSFSYTSSNLSVATITDNVITIVGAGNSLVTATQSVTDNYNSVTIETIFQVNKATPTITSFSIPPITFSSSSFQITQPTSNSSGSFSYTSSNLSVATISNDIITIVGVGHSIITATQSVTTNYYARTIQTQFQVNKATPTITSFSIPPKTFGDSSFQITQPKSNSSGYFSYTSSNLSVVTIIDNIITIVGAGHSIITAIQSATENYTEGTDTTIFYVSPVISNGV